jgi:hypothetical protein
MGVFFSRNSVQQVEPILHRFPDILCDMIQARLLNDGIVQINVIFLALAADTITQYRFGESLSLLEDESKAMDLYKTIQALAQMIPTVRQFPWTMPLALKLPVRAIRIVNGDLARVLELRHVGLNHQF